MGSAEQFTIEGAGGGSIRLLAGESIEITNLEGSQVVDLWAFVEPDLSEFLSAEHTRSCLEKLIPNVGDALYSNRRRPIITLTEDTSPGRHDLLLSACDEQRYLLLGHVGYHKNCADNLVAEMKGAGHSATELPSPFNIFQNVTVDQDGLLQIEAPLVQAGQSVTLRAEVPVLVVMSACPMDMALTNGPDKRSKPVHIRKMG